MSNIENDLWFYEEKGERKGGIKEDEIISMIKSGKLSSDTLIWKKGFPNWLTIQNSSLKEHIDDSLPPPLKGEHVNNTVIWFLAFAPIIGYLLEWIIAGMVYGNEWQAEQAVSSGNFFYVTLILNIGLSLLDEKKLKSAGHNTTKYRGWVWLVPVYLFQRAKNLNHNMSYFSVWIISFLLVIFTG